MLCNTSHVGFLHGLGVVAVVVVVLLVVVVLVVVVVVVGVAVEVIAASKVQNVLG